MKVATLIIWWYKENDRYLYTTFDSKENKLGSFFMNYQCTDGFDASRTIIYRHKAKDNSMFGSLPDFLDESYLE